MIMSTERAGQPADVRMIDDDLFGGPSASNHHAKVVLTWLDYDELSMNAEWWIEMEFILRVILEFR